MRAALLATLLLAATPAAAELLPARAHSIGPADSASRDAPVIEYAYGPRAQLSLGGEVGLLAAAHTYRLGLRGLAAFEDAQGHDPLPDETGRLRIEITNAWSLDCWARRALGARGALELGANLGFERARELRGTEAAVLVEPPRPGDIAFGAGGGWLALEAALRAPLGARWLITARVSERIFWNALPELAGSRSASDALANSVGEGLSHAPALELALRWQRFRRVRPLLALFAEALRPHDDSADPSYLVRALLAVGLPAEGGEALPFVALEVGSGKGLLVNRHEVRLSVGVRLAR